MEPGDRPPDFELPDQHGNMVRLSSMLGAGPVVVYFYPKADTIGCTREACGFRDEHHRIQDAGGTVSGISSDPVWKLAAFARKKQLPFALLSDEDGAVRNAWGVPRDMILLPGRVTYVLDKSGIIQRVIRSAVRMDKHVREAADAVRALAAVDRRDNPSTRVNGSLGS